MTPETRRRLARNIAAGISLMNLLYLDVWRLLSLGKTPSAFFLTLSPYDYLAAIATVIIWGGLLGIVATRISTMGPDIRRLVACAFLATIVILVDTLRKYNGVLLPGLLQDASAIWRVLGPVGSALVAVIIGVVTWTYAVTLARAYRRILLILSPFALFTIGSAVWSLAIIDFSAFVDVHRVTAPPTLPPRSRVVVIVFDELDNEIAFSGRPRDLALPNFDAFRAQAVTFDSAFSPAPNTTESLPSYLLGLRVDRLAAAGPRAFTATLLNGERLSSDTTPTIISRVVSHGVRAGLAGFYLPYCRLPLASFLDRCYWTPLVNGGAITGRSPGVLAAIDQWRSLNPVNNRLVHIRRFQDVTTHGAEFAADSTLGLVFLHVPVPHLPPIYDRRHARFRATAVHLGGYLDNVALADRALGMIRSQMAGRGQWERSTIVVTSDHPWRNKRDYMPGATDRRIPFLVKLPGQSSPDRIPFPVNSLIVDDIVLDLLAGRGQLADPQVMRSRFSSVSPPSH